MQHLETERVRDKGQIHDTNPLLSLEPTNNLMWSSNCLPFKRAHELTLGFIGVRVARSVVFGVMFCRSLFVHFNVPLWYLQTLPQPVSSFTEIVW